MSEIVDLMIVFRKSDSAVKELEERFWAVSDPDHADYGKFLSSSEIKRIVQVPLSHIESFTKWLKAGSSSCTTKVGPDGDTLRVRMLATDASRLFDTELKVYKHNRIEHALPIIRASGPYSLPKEFSNVVDIVGNLRHFPPVWTLLQNDISDEKNTSSYPPLK